MFVFSSCFAFVFIFQVGKLNLAFRLVCCFEAGVVSVLVAVDVVDVFVDVAVAVAVAAVYC